MNQLLSTENVVVDDLSRMVQKSENSNNMGESKLHSQLTDFTIVLSYFFKRSITFFVKDPHRVLYLAEDSRLGGAILVEM